MKFKGEIPNLIMVVVVNLLSVGIVASIMGDMDNARASDFEADANMLIDVGNKERYALSDFDVLREQINMRIQLMLEEVSEELSEIETEAETVYQPVYVPQTLPPEPTEQQQIEEVELPEQTEITEEPSPGLVPIELEVTEPAPTDPLTTEPLLTEPIEPTVPVELEPTTLEADNGGG
ncbi:MAG: hypothetical protein FWG67_05995 [Defluviitaleaceae bacterium]|nr:hypothetical protein [Defluviitaleaceae bacterium]